MIYLNKELKSFSDEELIQFYHNAYETQCFSLGHYKGQQNEMAKLGYQEELAKRGIIKIPERQGIFNGKAAF